MPRPGQVLGLVGTNGIGKSTALKILAGKMKPNLGRYETPPDWEEILVHFRGRPFSTLLFLGPWPIVCNMWGLSAENLENAVMIEPPFRACQETLKLFLPSSILPAFT